MFTAQQRAFLLATAAVLSITAAADEVGVDVRDVSRWEEENADFAAAILIAQERCPLDKPVLWHIKDRLAYLFRGRAVA